MHRTDGGGIGRGDGENSVHPDRPSRQDYDAHASRPVWPMIVLRSPKGWTGPKEVDGLKTEGFWRSHQVPLSGLADNPEHLKLLEEWFLSYRPEELFDARELQSPRSSKLP